MTAATWRTVSARARTEVKPPRSSPALVFWALAAVALLVSHDAIWLVQLGPGEELAAILRSSQHGYWAAASVLVLVVAAVAALVTLTRAIGLVRNARRLDAPVGRIRGRGVLGRAGLAWIRLLAVVGIGFALQENVEHYLAHGHVLGLGAITGPEYPLAVPVLAAVTAVAAILAALVRAVEHELVAGIAAARRIAHRPPRTTRHALDRVARRRRPAMAGSDAGRAPPLLLVGT